jgi:hypothetical protein
MGMNNDFAYPKYKPCGTRRVTVDGMGVVFHVYKNLTRKNSDGDGASVFFLRNNAKVNKANQFGLKVFYDKDEAYYSWLRQKKAADAGLAPPVGKMFMVVGRTGKDNYWGYQTAIADTSMFDKYKDDFELERLKPFKNFASKLRRINVPLTKDLKKDYMDSNSYDRLPEKLKAKLGDDLHGYNIGMWKDGVVCIDFGVESVIIDD